MSQLKKIEEQLEKAPNIKSMMQLEIVQQRFIANYQATTRKTDGVARFQSEVFAYLEIVADKPALAAANRFSHFAAIIKAGTTGLSFRDNKLYVMPGPNGTVKVQSSPAGKREMMENMESVKRFPEAQIVLKGDVFEVDKLNGVVSMHKSTEKSAVAITLDNILFSYQRVYWKDGTINDVVVTHDELVKARAKSPAQSEQSFWATWPGEACKKVATNRAYNRYHKYPNNLIESVGEMEHDEDEDVVVDTPHQEVKAEPQQVATPVVEATAATKAVDEFLKD